MGCCGCGLPGCITGLVGWPLGFGYFIDLFKNQVENYVLRLVGKRRPRKILVSMIYYPDVNGGGWADGALGALCYGTCPGRLQAAIRMAFEHGTRRIRIPGTEVVPVPLFEVLDSTDSRDYLQRVEPSVEGGRKMGRYFADIISGTVQGSVGNEPLATDAAEPVAGESISLSTRT